MSIITIKISKCIQLQVIYSDITERLQIKLLFKFNEHNSNWLYLNLNEQMSYKLKNILNKVLINE